MAYGYMKKIWRIWAKSLGEKASSCDKESDNVAIVRTFIFITYLITNIAIVTNVVRHWNTSECTQKNLLSYGKK